MVDRIAEIWWCEDHRSGLGGENEPKVCDEGNRQGMRRCRLVTRVVVDPANLPPERMERAAQATEDLLQGAYAWDIMPLPLTEAIITAFLSDGG